MNNGKTKMENTVTKTSNKTNKVSIDVLIAAREKRHRKRTQGVNHALLQQLKAYAGDALSLHNINEDFCARFADFLLDRVSTGSARTYLHKLHALLEYAVSNHFIKSNQMLPVKNLIPNASTPQRTHLSQEELSALGNTPCRHSETKRAFLFACQTGLRLSDIETLQWNDIVDNNGVMTINKIQIKTGKEVVVPLNRIALQLLDSPIHEGPVFRLKSRSVISSDLRQWATDAGIDKRLTFHVSRHTFATLSIASGVNIYVVSKLCGHTTVKTTEIYAHMTDKTLWHGVNLLSDSLMEHYHENGKKRRHHLLTNVRKMMSRLFPMGRAKTRIQV